MVILNPDTGYGDILAGAVNVEEGEGGWVGTVTEGSKVILVEGNLEGWERISDDYKLEAKMTVYRMILLYAVKPDLR